MYIELKCHFCDKRFRVDFTKTEFDLIKCPCCGQLINHSDVFRIRYITEILLTNIRGIEDVSICGIYADDSLPAGLRKFNSDVFNNDIDNLIQLFRSSPSDVQNKLTDLMDKFFLLVYHDASNSDLDTLELTHEKIRTIFWDKVNVNRQKTMQMLELEDQSTESGTS